MRIPWVQCRSSLDQYCIQPLIEATTIVTTVDQLLHYTTYITLLFLHRYEHGDACLVHIHVTHYLYLTHLWEPY